MQTYSALVELARICASQARFTVDREVARELWRMALEYQYKAAALDNGKLPDGKIARSGAAQRARPADRASA
jgi:hypothetical protein